MKPERPGCLLGIDVSGWQDHVDWKALAAAGARFAYVKRSQGTSAANGDWAHQWAGAAAAGLHRGAYHFGTPQSKEADAVAEAKACLKLLGPDARTGLPVALDLEWYPEMPSLSALPPHALTAWAAAFLQTVELETGRSPLIYTNPGFWHSRLGQTPALNHWRLWLSHYTHGDPIFPRAWKKWTLWQFAGGGTIPGVADPDKPRSGRLERLDLIWFRGTEAELAELAGAPTVASIQP